MTAKRRATTRARKGPARSSKPQQAGELLKHTWENALAGLNSAQRDLERQVRQLLKRNKIDASDGGALLRSLNAAFARERVQAVKALDGRLKDLQRRAKAERKAVGRRIDAAVQSALGSLNIPSRREIAALTRKVEELSKRIDRLRR